MSDISRINAFSSVQNFDLRNQAVNNQNSKASEQVLQGEQVTLSNQAQSVGTVSLTNGSGTNGSGGGIEPPPPK